ncbi:UPF0182 family protein [Demequina sp. EGI L300058]|uniref:UPF0182 protein QQX02_08655 n=2 Tax=Demequina muriae TaxID=3051664 RepID=A0ABT8GHT1_9MICO|nr:UPF0182 family protein [Demequina sp. EGI L300058]MDN4480989.1 UPF0182 family protein [Demequina sp. EGI L300058]
MQAPRRRSPMLVTGIVVAVLVVLTIIAAQVWTEIAWYRQLGFAEVLTTQWITRAVLFFGFGLIAALAVWITLWVARRVRPAVTGKRTTLDQYREQIQPLEKIAMVALPAFVGLIAGLAMSARWVDFLAWLNHEEFGVADPEFGLDASYYVFTLPVLQTLSGFVLTIAILCTILAAFVHLLYGGIGGGRGFVASGGARIQLAISGLIVMLGIAANYWLDRFALLNSEEERFYGASYTDVNAILPGRTILVGIAVLVGLLFLAVIWRGDWRIPAVGVSLMVLSALVIGGIYPAVVQRFQVEPNAQSLQEPFIQRNIDATQYAYGLDNIETMQYEAATEAEADALRANAETTTQIRLLDPTIVGPAFQQLQQNKQYYNFGDELAVDRYTIDGESRDTVIAVRELDLNGLSNENRSWVNDHTVFTHGFGVVAAYGNRTTVDGQPAFYEGNIPSNGGLGPYEPRIYFGQTLPDYSIVGAPADTNPWELDYPDDDSPNGQINTTYEGEGGPSIGTFVEKVLYAIKFGEEQILFSDRVTSESQILYNRDPLERVAKVAPYLELDQTTYPAVVDEEVVWVVDGYTTTGSFPYSAPVQATGVFAGSATSQFPTSLNYVRNSVKATVNAYDGSVTLYAWDEEDPILQTWQNIFPNAIEPMSEISSDLMSHLRYPEDLFSIQRHQLQRYHVTDASAFYSGQDIWSTPADPVQAGEGLQPPYYLSLQMPGQDEPSFSLTSNFIPGGNTDRNILTGYLAVDSETGSTAGEVAEGFGTLRLLELPRDTTIPGPGQVQNNFNSNSDAQTTLNLLRQGETDVVNGNLLTLPVGGGLLYVQPVYVQSSEGTRVPLLRKVFVSFGDEVGFADTLQEALDQVFGEGAADGAVEDPRPPTEDGEAVAPGEAGDEPVDGEEPADAEEPAEGDEAPIDPGTLTDLEAAQADLRDALERAQQAIADGQTALQASDFTAYGTAQDELAAALEDAVVADERIAAIQSEAAGESNASPSPEPTP